MSQEKSVNHVSGMHLYAVGYYGEILHYDGADWTPTPSPRHWALFDVWGVATDDIVAVGTGGLILHFDGTEWQIEESGTGSLLYGVWGCAPDTFYAVGRSGNVLRFNGNAWESLPQPTESDLLTVWGTSGDNVYIGARDALWHFDGETWTDVGIEVRVRVLGIWGSSATDVWVTDGTNWLWHYDGITWETVQTMIMYPFTNLWGFASDDVFGVGQGGMVSHFDESQWALDEVFDDNIDLGGIWGTAATDLWVCGVVPGEGGALFHREGSDWTRVGQSLSDGKLEDIWSDATGERTFAVGRDMILQKEGGQWTSVPVTPPSNLTAVWGAPSGEVFAVGENRTCLLFDGSTWQNVGPNSDMLNFHDVWGTSRDNVWVGAQDGLWRFNGAGWDAPDISEYVTAVWGADETNVYSAGWGEGGLHGVVRCFDGDTWELIYDDSTTGVAALTGAGPRDILISVWDLDSHREDLLRYDGMGWSNVTPTQVSRIGAIGGNAQLGFVVCGCNLRDGFVVTDQTLLRLANGRWEALNPRYGADFEGIWGGLENGVYLVGRSQIVQCLSR